MWGSCLRRDRNLALRFSRRGFCCVWTVWLEAIADPGLGQNIFRVGGIRFDLLAQLVDDHTEVFGLFAVVGAPDRLEEAPVRQRLSLVGDQVLEDIIFFWGEMHGMAAHGD